MVLPEAKYQFAEKLWKKVGPSSRRALRFGPDILPSQILTQVETHMSEVVLDHSIPAALKRRFNGLSSGDVAVEEEILNELQQMDVRLVLEGARFQLDTMRRYAFGPNAQEFSCFEHELAVGKHKLKLIADRKATGCEFEDYDKGLSFDGRQRDWSWLLWPVLIIGFVIVMNLAG